MIVTAGYDKLIRIWNLEKKHGNVNLIEFLFLIIKD